MFRDKNTTRVVTRWWRQLADVGGVWTSTRTLSPIASHVFCLFPNSMARNAQTKATQWLKDGEWWWSGNRRTSQKKYSFACVWDHRIVCPVSRRGYPPCCGPSPLIESGGLAEWCGHFSSDWALSLKKRKEKKKSTYTLLAEHDAMEWHVFFCFLLLFDEKGAATAVGRSQPKFGRVWNAVARDCRRRPPSRRRGLVAQPGTGHHAGRRCRLRDKRDHGSFLFFIFYQLFSFSLLLSISSLSTSLSRCVLLFSYRLASLPFDWQHTGTGRGAS